MPRIGIRSPNVSITLCAIIASAGCPGPGDNIINSGDKPSMYSIVTTLERTT